MITIVGEYPYYRARRTDWASDLARLRDEGVTTISFYIPWRLHELPDNSFDFSGREVSNADLVGFFALLRKFGIEAVVKPGPFIHAEVRYGGLPDRFVHRARERNAGRTQQTNFGIGFGDDPPLSPDDPDFVREATSWLECVRDRIISPNIDLITAIQIGNEGVFSDAAKPTHHPRVVQSSPIKEVLSVFSEVFAELQVQRYVNLPLPDPGFPDHLAYDWWASQVLPLTRLVSAAGYTAWAGPTTTSDAALARTLLAGPHFSMGCVEENWGHVWDSDLYRDPSVVLHHSLLTLALGSPTLSIYTTCTTDAMDESLYPSTTDLIAEGMEPRDFMGPYCPAAPTTAGGGDGDTLKGLRRLVSLCSALEQTDREWEIDYALNIVIDPQVSFVVWKVARLASDLLLNHDVHAHITFGPSNAESKTRPIMSLEPMPNTEDQDNVLVAVRVDGTDSSRKEIPLASLTAHNVVRSMGEIWRPQSNHHPSTYRVRWVDRDGSGAGIVFIFNRSDEVVEIEGNAGLPPLALGPYGAVVMKTTNGITWEIIH